MPKNFADGDFLSSTVLNNATVHKMTGTEIIALTSAELIPGYLIYCTATNAPYTIGKLYIRNQDNTAFEIVGLMGHTHLDATTGGALADVHIANITTTLSYNKRWAKANSFYSSVVSSGTVTDDSTNARIQLQTGTTSGGNAMIWDGGYRQLDYSKPSTFEVGLDMSSSTNFQVKLGIFAENIGSSTSVAKYGIEGCSSSGTTWLIYSADGTTRSTLTTASPVVTSGRATYRVEHVPGTSVKLYVNGALSATKTTNIPSTGLIGSTVLFKAAVQNTAAENKALYMYGGPIIEGSTSI
jgi:hypothetical protein